MEKTQTKTTTYQAQPQQNKFHASPAKFRLLGGAAGGGKSEAMVFECIALANEHPNAHILMMRKTFPELKMSLIMRFLERLPKDSYKYNASDHFLIWKRTNSRIQFGHCQSNEDVYRYQGAEFDFIGVDELTQFNEYTFKFLISRLRSSKPNLIPKFFAATNPGSIGHSWVKRLFIENRFNKEEQEANWQPEDFEFIPATIQDNKYIDPGYVTRLKAMPEPQRSMYLHGNWDVFAGQFFENFDRNTHIRKSHPIPDTYKKYRSIDFGRTAPFATLWGAIDYDGNLIIYREYYERGREVDENTRNIQELSTTENYEWTIIDSAVFAKTGFGESIGERMWNLGLHTVPAQKGRLNGWTILKQYMRFEKDTQPKLIIFDSCPNLIKEIQDAVYSEKRPEDLHERCDDHALDALQYLCTGLRGMISSEPQRNPAEGRASPFMIEYFKTKQESSHPYPYAHE